MIIALCVASFVSFVVCAVLLYYSVLRNFELMNKFEALTTQVEESLDIIDVSFKSISDIAETPIAFDDPVVHQLLADIKETRRAILLIANKIVAFQDESDDSEEG